MKQAKSKKLDVELSEQEILQKLLASKVKSIDPNYVFQGIMGQNGVIDYRLAGKKLSPAQVGTLRTEAQLLIKTTLWKVMTETLRNQAHLKLFEKMNSLDDSHFGKALLQSITIFETIVDNIKNAQTEVAPPHVYGKPLSTEG